MKRIISTLILILFPLLALATPPPIPTIVAVTNHGTFTYPTPIAGVSGTEDFQITISFAGTPSPTNPFYFYQEIDDSLWAALQALSISSAFSSVFASGPTSYTGYSAKSVTVTSTTGFYTGNYFVYDYTAYMPLPPGTYNTYIWMADSSLTPVATYVLPIIIWTPTPGPTLTATLYEYGTPTYTQTPQPTLNFDTPVSTPTSTQTLTAIPTWTYTATITATQTFTSTATNTPTQTQTATNTPTAASTSTITPYPSYTYTYTPTPTNTVSPTVTPTFTPTPQPSYTTPTPTFTATPVTTPELDIVNSNTYKARVRWPNADTSCTYLLQYGLSLEESQSLTQYYNISPTNNYFEVEIPGLIQGQTNEIRITQYNPNYNAVVSNIVYVTPTPIPAKIDIIETPTP